MHGLTAFLKARDFLLANRTDYEAAHAGFSWPELDEFNWALDYFDTFASGNPEPALLVLTETGLETKVSFAEMAERSDRTANFLRSLGVQRGDHVLVMLGNEVALCEILLAAFKLGAVVIPSTTLLTTEDLRDRLDRGEVRHVVAVAEQAQKFAELTGSYTRIAVGENVHGWQSYDGACSAAERFVPDGRTRATDPLLLYFTSGTTGKPKLVQHSHRSYPVGHLSTMYWIGLERGDLHWNISSPGWAKHAWSCLFAPWNAGACVFAYNYARFQAAAVLDVVRRQSITTLCAPPTVWRMLVQEKLADFSVKLREVASAGEPLNPEVIDQVRAAWGLTIRDGYGQTETTALIGNSPGQPMKATFPWFFQMAVTIGPATLPAAIRMDTFSSSDVRMTSSRLPTIESALSSWKVFSSSTRQWRKPQSCPVPILSVTRSPKPLSCFVRATPHPENWLTTSSLSSGALQPHTNESGAWNFPSYPKQF